MLMTLPLTWLRSPISRSFSSRVEKSRNGTRCVRSFTGSPPSVELISLLFVHRHHDLADLRVAQHVGMRVGDFLQRKSSVEHRLERAALERAKQIGGEALTAHQRLLGRTGAERHPDDTDALARDLIE